MSKIRPWLGLYLWMNEERQEELSRILNKGGLEATSSQQGKSKDSAKIVSMPNTRT